MQSKFITFEGSDGAGKTTVLKKVAAKLKPKLGNKFIITREPGGDKISENIRKIILGKDNFEMDVKTEALLYAAARRQHIKQTILPALEQGEIVLSDRYVDSSIAYQGAGRKIGEKLIENINKFATNGLQPDLTFYFEIPINIGLKRIAQHRNKEDINRLDQESKDFYLRVQNSYNKLAKNNPKRIIKIDATKSISEVSDKVASIILKFLNNN